MSSKEDEELARHLQDVIFDALNRTATQDNGRSKMLRLLADFPPPTNADEGDLYTGILSEVLVVTLGSTVLYHIENHGGKDCAKDIIETVLTCVRDGTYAMIKDGCKFADTKNPLEPDLNKATTQEILDELEAKGK